MTTDFDPYYKWLGIPPEEQPPNHYRLLGIPPFTSDMEVIDNAVDQRMAHLRSFQLGQRSQLCQQLLNEVAFVKTCLQDPEMKAAYDRTLINTRYDHNNTTFPANTIRARAAGKSSKRKADSVAVQIIKHCIASITGLFLGYIVLLSLGPEYDFLNISDRLFPPSAKTSQAPRIHASVKNNQPTNPTPGTNSKIEQPDSPSIATSIEPTPPTSVSSLLPDVENVAPETPIQQETDEELAAQCLARSKQSIDAGNLTGALTHIEEYCKLSKTNSSLHKLRLLSEVLNKHPRSISDSEIVSDMIKVLEQSMETGNKSLVESYLNKVLIAARKTNNDQLIRRATSLRIQKQ